MSTIKHHLGWIIAVIIVLAGLGYFVQMFYFRGPEFSNSGDQQAVDVTTTNNALLLADAKLGLEIFTPGNVEHPRLSTTYKAPGRDGYSQIQTSTDGKTAFLASAQGGFDTPGYDGWLDIVNVVNPSSPTLISSLRINGQITGQGKFEGINHMVLKGNDLFLTDNGGNFEVVDVSDLQHPQKISEIAADYVSGMRDLVIIGNDVYTDFYQVRSGTSSTTYGVRVIDVAQPSKPKALTDFQTVTSTLATDGDHRLFLSDGNLQKPQLVILDVVSPMQLKEVGRFATKGGSGKPTLDGNHLWVPFNTKYSFISGEKKTSGVVEWNISDPANPTIVQQLGTRGFATRVTISGKFLYIADGVEGLTSRIQ